MGVPKFYRYVSERYPAINVDLDAAIAPAIDNLYLDMNGVVHNCARASSTPGQPHGDRYHTVTVGPRSNADIFLAVFKYIDNLFSLVQPRKLVFFAVDGVAPRAKMNQQRSRRFRSAKEREEEHARKLEEDPMYRAANQTPFDSNCITPGTAFMTELTAALEYFTHKRMSEDAAWSRVQVILSGAEVPGEGEHKIMEYIRAMKLSKQLLPNTRHCVYGLDADLIMLALVTHEPHFVILREKIDYTAFFRRKPTARPETALDTIGFGDFQLLSTGLLREYLAIEIGMGGLDDRPFFDIERVVDDFVVIAMLVGNDFLPNLPAVEMAENGLGLLLLLYKRLVGRFGGYLSKSGRPDPRRLELFLLMLGVLEEDITKKKNDNGGSRGGRRAAISGRSDVEMDLKWGFEQSSLVPPAWTDAELESEIARWRQYHLENDKTASAKSSYYRSKVNLDISKEEGAAGVRAMVSAYLEGICWTLKYYFEGCASWRWFYRYHYAPMPSDFIGIADVLNNVRFVQGTPFKPVEQLLSVLPPSSSWCLPRPYRLLMTHPSSPIKDKYPDDFQVDLNGKRNDWEAVVLLPFIEAESLLKAVQSIPLSELTPGERARNSHGPSKHFSSSGATNFATKVVSPFPTRLRDIASTAVCVQLKLPFVGNGVPFPSTWTEGTHAAGTHPDVADLPSFSPLVHSGRLEVTGVNVFGQPTKGESVLVTLGTASSQDRDFITFDSAEDNEIAIEGLTMGNCDTNDRKDSVTERFPAHWISLDAAISFGLGPGKTVWVGYPWRLSAIVHSVSDRKTCMMRIKANGDDGLGVTAEPVLEDAFILQANTVAANLMDNRAIDSGRPNIIIEASVVERKDALTGSPVELSASTATYIAQSVIPMSSSDTEGLAASMIAAASRSASRLSALSMGERVLVVGRGAFCGCSAYVETCRDDGYYVLRLSVRAPYAREPAFGYRVVASVRASERWMSTGKAASILGLAVPVLLTITGSVRVRVPNSSKEEIDIGLGIRYSGRGLFVPGYARVDEHGSFLLSSKTTDLVAAYRQNFPQLFQSLTLKSMENNDSKRTQRRAGRAFDASDLFGFVSDPKEALIAAASWVATSELATLPLVAEGALVLPKDAIMELEKEASIARDLHADAMEFGEGDRRKAQVVLPRWLCCNGRESSEAYASMFSHGAIETVADKSVQVRLGDRVVNRLAVGPVPFGLRGTVVGIHVGKSSSSKDERNEGEDTELNESIVSLNGNLVEVLFDEGFIGGGDLNGRCNAGRGKAVNPDSLIILRPDRENQYYSSNYARVARAYSKRHAKELSFAMRETEKRALEKRAIANAAVLSYAGATRGERVSIQSEADPERTDRTASNQRSEDIGGSKAAGQEGVESYPSPQDFPIPSFLKGLPGPSGSRSEHGPDIASSSGFERDRASSSMMDAGIPAEGFVQAIDTQSVEMRLREMLKLGDASASGSNVDLRIQPSVAAESSAPVKQSAIREPRGNGGRGAGLTSTRANKIAGNRGRARGQGMSRAAGQDTVVVEPQGRGRESFTSAAHSSSSCGASVGGFGDAAARNRGRARKQPQSEFATQRGTSTERTPGHGRARGRGHWQGSASSTGVGSSLVSRSAASPGEADDEILRFWEQLQSDK